MDNNLLYYLGFSRFVGIGPERLKLLIGRFDSPAKAYFANRNDLAGVIGKKLAGDFINFRSAFDPLRELEKLKNSSINVISFENPNYPEKLKNISDPPICLYVKGILKPAKFFSIVGTRMPSAYGERVAYKLASDLAGSGFSIVSGMAYGVDGIAHKAALDNDAYTVAVLGCGVNRVYPAAHLGLYEKIIDSGGAVISEYPSDVSTVRGMFVARNRIVSGMAIGILVIEGNARSGTLITARYAAEQGRDIFAVPGMITDDSAVAPNILIQQGAKLVTTAADILGEYGMESVRESNHRADKLTENEREIADLIKANPVRTDELVAAIKQPVSVIMNILTSLEVEGIIVKNDNDYYEFRQY